MCTTSRYKRSGLSKKSLNINYVAYGPLTRNLLRSKLKTVGECPIRKIFRVLGSAAEQIFIMNHVARSNGFERTFDDLATDCDDRLNCLPPDLHIPCS